MVYHVRPASRCHGHIEVSKTKNVKRLTPKIDKIHKARRKGGDQQRFAHHLMGKGYLSCSTESKCKREEGK